MTSRDRRDIQNLYYFHRFTQASIARLYGLSHVRIRQIVFDNAKQSLIVISDLTCMLCGVEDEIKRFYIDNNEDNNNPQNVLMLCEPDRRRIIHLQLRRKLKHPILSSQL